MIRFENVSKRFTTGQQALLNVNFSLERGRMAFLTGHSGAGKSTLLKLIPALLRPTAGRVLVDGVDIARLPDYRIPYLRRRIGLIFQDHHLLEDRTLYDNVALPLVVSGYRPAEIARRVRAALDKVGLLDRERAYPLELSGGEQQRVNIARALVNRPAIILADEPTGNLDPDLSLEIMNEFCKFNEVGVTVLVASHDHDLIERFDTPRLILENGQLASDEAQP
ncbi:MAG: cell division ATP-binding protein FtsE [Halothiobacillaceae bacterium]|jgi:cell division transport system ATP-binding protein|nr:cell division ATP-binding protein FtsE [Halothiobacillaceae bacterium]MDY0050883.1 cell division ATP-binding protein FtsE [Halothiobacillaceae bacterium]